MGTVGNQNPWAPYETYKDCSQGLCSVYCPQWCYIIFPPPPFDPTDEENDDSGTGFSPLIIALIGILASAFLLISYYIIMSKYCRRRGRRDRSLELDGYRDETNPGSGQESSAGLDEALIKSITVCKYKKGDGLVEGTDCSVCLSEFQEDENLRLLPKCNHAFHLPCIDTWLKSHSSCPLCRSNIAAPDSLPPQTQAPTVPLSQVNVSTHEYQHRNDPVLVIQDLDGSVPQDAVVNVNLIGDFDTKVPTRDIEGRGGGITESRPESDAILLMRRSASMNSLIQDRVSSAGILCEGEDEKEIQVDDTQVSIEIESSENPEGEQGKLEGRKGVLHFVRNPLAMRRSISTGRFMFTRYGKGKNCVIPN